MTQFMPTGERGYTREMDISAKCPDVGIRKR